MKTNNVLLVALLATALGAPAVAGAGSTTDTPLGTFQWFGNIYMKVLDGNRYTQGGLYTAAETTPSQGGGDQGQGTQLELMFSDQVSKQVEIGGAIQSRFNRNYWTNYGGFNIGPVGSNGSEQDPLSNQYIKLRNAWARITPGYSWLDSATIGMNDWGMFDPSTVGKIRYIDRFNGSGVLLQGSAFDKKLRWDLARISMAFFQGPQFSLGPQFSDAPAYILQAKYAPTSDFNATFIYDYSLNRDRTANDLTLTQGQAVHTRYKDAVWAAKAQYTGLGFLDFSGAYYQSQFQIDPGVCDMDPNGNCRFSPTPMANTNGKSYYLNVDWNKTGIDGLTVAGQYFFIGADYVSVTAARREADVLLTGGQESTWMWGRPDMNCVYTQPLVQIAPGSAPRCGNPGNLNAANGPGYGGWSGEVQQVVSGMADNDFTDFDEPVAYSVLGWKGFTIVPKYKWRDWKFEAEYSDIGFDSNWQACGQTTNGLPDKSKCIYPRMEGTHEWGLGGDYRSPYAPYQDRKMWIWAAKLNYTFDIGKGIDWMLRYKHIEDRDYRVTSVAGLNDAYNGYTGGTVNPDWKPNVGLGGCVTCDDRRAVYNTYGTSAGYQVTPDLYLKLIYEKHKVTLRDGTIDVAPVGLGFEGSNDFGWTNYLTGEHDKNRFGLEGHYFLPGIEFGGNIDWLTGTYDPAFFTNQGDQVVRLNPGPGVLAIPTVLGNIATEETKYKQYRLKIFMKVVF